MRVHGNVSEHIESHLLIADVDFNKLDISVLRHKASCLNIVASLLITFTHGAYQVILVLVDFPSGKTPVGILLPTLDQNDMIHGVVKHNDTSDWHPSLVHEELIECAHMITLGEG